MSLPDSPAAWLRWSCYVRDSQARAFSLSLEYGGRSDFRVADSREAAISVLSLAERASHTVCGNGVGFKLLLEHFAGEASWWSFTEREQEIIRRTNRTFRRELQRAKFLPDPDPEHGDPAK